MNNPRFPRQRPSVAALCLAALCGLVAAVAPARADVNIASVPLFLTPSVDPNVMFTFDDSGSMQWEYMPDGNQFRFTVFMFPRPNALYGGANYANQVPSFRDNSLHNYFGRSANNNGVFYNPDITYVPWANADGSFMPDADPSAALYHPARPGLGGLDLTVQQTQVATWFRGNAFGSAFCDPCGGNHTYWPITYYNYQGGTPPCAPATRECRSRARRRPVRPLPARGVTRTRDEEIQNFANWFQYYRSRALSAFAGIGRAFTRLPSNGRVGYGTINQGTSTVDGESTRTLVTGVRPFSAAVRVVTSTAACTTRLSTTSARRCAGRPTMWATISSARTRKAPGTMSPVPSRAMTTPAPAGRASIF